MHCLNDHVTYYIQKGLCYSGCVTILAHQPFIIFASHLSLLGLKSSAVDKTFYPSNGSKLVFWFCGWTVNPLSSIMSCWESAETTEQHDFTSSHQAPRFTLKELHVLMLVVYTNILNNTVYHHFYWRPKVISCFHFFLFYIFIFYFITFFFMCILLYLHKNTVRTYLSDIVWLHVNNLTLVV